MEIKAKLNRNEARMRRRRASQQPTNCGLFEQSAFGSLLNSDLSDYPVLNRATDVGPLGL